jgi:hypothetical protein
MNNKKFFGVGGITQVGTPPVSLIQSFTSTSTTFSRQLSNMYGLCFHPTDGYLYTTERDGSTGNFYFIKRNATTGAYISTSSSSIGTGQLYGIAITSDGSFWVIQRSTSSKLRKYNSSGVYQNFEFSVVGYYADSVVCDNNDILYVNRTNSSTVYTYNTSGVYQGAFNLAGTNDYSLMHSDGVLHKGSNATTVYTRDIAASSNTGSWLMPSGTAMYMTNDYSPTLGFAWIIDVSNSIQARKFTPNF